MKINIDNDLVNTLVEHQKETSFKKLEEFIEFILTDYLEKNKNSTSAISNSDQNLLNERLKNLGYL